LTIEYNLFGRVLALVFNEVAGLNEHPARSAGWVENRTVVRLDDIDNELDQRRRREEFAVVVRFLNRKLGEKIFVDATEDIAAGLLDPATSLNTRARTRPKRLYSMVKRKTRRQSALPR
jgi:hypothetical protein